MTGLRKLFSDRTFNGELISIALPTVLQSLMLSLVAAADALMLGTIRQDSMAAVSLATQIQFVQNMILFAMTSALMLLAAQYYGKKDISSVKDIFCIGLRVNSVVGIAFFIGTFFFPENLMMIFTNEHDLIKIGAEYLRIASFSYLLTGISQCYLCFMKVCDRAKKAAVISSSAVIINIVFNAVLIYGLFGLPRLEEKGAAAATLFARIIELCWCLAVSFRKDFIRPSFRRLFRWNKLLSLDFIKVELPIIGASMLWGLGFTSYSAFMGHLGKDAAAANSVTAVVRDIVCSICDGLCAGVRIIVGKQLGAGKLDKGREYGIKSYKISFLLGFMSTAVMLAVTPALRAFVSLTDRAEELLVGMMIIMAFYMIGRVVNTIIINGVFTAGGDTLFDTYSLVVTMWCLAVPLAALGTFVFHWNPLVVYSMTCLDEVGKIPWVVYHFKKYKWVRDLTRDEDELRSS